jgi:hypothetical protein
MLLSRRSVAPIALLFLLAILISCAGGFIGVVPLYPHMSNLEICSPPEVHNFSDSPSWQLWVATCFNTLDTPTQVSSWYERIGWTGRNVPVDKFGLVITGKLNLGSMMEVAIKRQVLASDDSVIIRTEYDLYSSLCPLQTWRYQPGYKDTWSVWEVGSLLKMTLKVMLMDCIMGTQASYLLGNSSWRPAGKTSPPRHISTNA